MKLFRNLGSSSTKNRDRPMAIKRGMIVLIDDREFKIESIEYDRSNVMLFCIPKEKE
jgi:predicted phosphatase